MNFDIHFTILLHPFTGWPNSRGESRGTQTEEGKGRDALLSAAAAELKRLRDVNQQLLQDAHQVHQTLAEVQKQDPVPVFNNTWRRTLYVVSMIQVGGWTCVYLADCRSCRNLNIR